MGFFQINEQISIYQKNFPENTLVYINQGTISPIKSELAIYINCFVLEQIIPALNSLQDIDSYQCKQNEVKIAAPLYDLSNGKFIGLDLRPNYIVLRGDPDGMIFRYDFNPETSKVLFSSSKERRPTAFTCTTFRKHYEKIVDERYTRKSSNVFFYLPSTTDRKESINQYKNNVSLNPIDCDYENFKNFH